MQRYNSSEKFQSSGPPSVSACLSVCFRCKPADWSGSDDARPGAALAAGLAGLIASRGSDGVAMREIRCLSQCKRPCVVAFSGEGRFTYLFGDLDPIRDVHAVLDAFALYLASPEGFMERRDRPEALRAGILGRVPPLGSTHPIVQTARLA